MPKTITDSTVKVSGGNYGQAIDIIAQTDQSVFRCLLQQGFAVAFIRAYLPNGGGSPDINCIANIHNAINEGLGVEIYVEPQPNSAKSGGGHFLEVYTFLTNKDIAVKAIWIKITTPIIWPNNQAANVNFINEFILYAWQYGVVVGIYTNWYDWKQITNGELGVDQRRIRFWYWNMLGSGWNAATSPTFDDFRPFGGFNVPALKQYVENIYVCGISASLSIYINKMPMKTSLPIDVRLEIANNATVGNLSSVLNFQDN
ncbi:unnamed protein product [Litomosoides sigmodontis]|uniref:Lysozyme n=1 Tax=Litomosoides sigmodontis TaxID=42156 RepID=A0A3P6U386_LITSI|nr:unnamed protein product [Litomosoides sigmodontis]